MPDSRGISSSPVAGSGIVALLVVLVDGGDLGHERVIRVRVSQQRADGEQHLRDGQSGRPLVFEDVQADGSVCVDVRMVNFGREGNLRRLEGIVRREVDVEEEYAAGIWRIIRSHNGGLPVELVSLIRGTSRAVGGRVSAKVDEFLLDSFKRHNIVYNRGGALCHPTTRPQAQT